MVYKILILNIRQIIPCRERQSKIDSPKSDTATTKKTQNFTLVQWIPISKHSLTFYKHYLHNCCTVWWDGFFSVPCHYKIKNTNIKDLHTNWNYSHPLQPHIFSTELQAKQAHSQTRWRQTLWANCIKRSQIYPIIGKHTANRMN